MTQNGSKLFVLVHQRTSRELALDKSPNKLSETKWLKSSLLLLSFYRRRRRAHHKNRTSTFGFALSCNFYERPNVSKEWKTIIFMFFRLLLSPRSRADKAKTSEWWNNKNLIIVSRAGKVPKMCVRLWKAKTFLLINFNFSCVRTSSADDYLLFLFVQVFCCGSLRRCFDVC